MPCSVLRSAALAGFNAWAVVALRVHAPLTGAEAGGGEGVVDIPMEWATLLPAALPDRRETDVCRVVEKPEAIPRASVDTLTDDDFACLPAGGEYDTRFQRFFRKLRAGGSVKMVVLGGSFPAGADCEDPADGQKVTGYQCAWPARVQTALSKLFPRSSISLLNMAHGGTTTSVILGAIGLLLRDVPGGPGEIDLIAIDTLLNDSRKGAIELEQAALEKLVRVLHEMAPQATVVPVIDACEECLATASYHRAVAAFYGLPFVDYASLLERTANRDLWYLTEAGFHPRWQSHQILADVVVGTWEKAFRSLCAGAGAPEPAFPTGTLAAQETLDHLQICMVGRSEYHAAREGGPQPTIVNGWRLFEDRPGKPGWISEEPGAVLSFRLSFGDQPKLLFTFLRTYENIGSAILTMNHHSLPVQGLDAEHRFSQSHTQWFNANSPYFSNKEEGRGGFSVRPRSKDLVLNVTAPGAKFKIISVISC